MSAVVHHVIPDAQECAVGREYSRFVDVDDVSVCKTENLFARFHHRRFVIAALSVGYERFHMDGSALDLAIEIAVDRQIIANQESHAKTQANDNDAQNQSADEQDKQ